MCSIKAPDCTMNKPETHILIVGAGIGGLVLAQVLRKNNVSFEIFERDRDAHDRLQGWSIALHSMLDELHDSIPTDMGPVELTSNLLPLTIPPEFAFYPKAGGKTGVRDDGTGKIIRANRNRVREWLSADINIQFNKKVVSINEEEDSATVHFADHTSATGTIVVGADGAHSAVRKHLQRGGDGLRFEPAVFITAEYNLDEKDMWDQLLLGSSMYGVDYNDPNGDRTWFFNAVDSISTDEKHGKFYFNLVWKDEEAKSPDHWSQSMAKSQLYEIMRKRTSTLPTRFRGVVDKVTPDSMYTPPIRLSTVVLDSLPVGCVTLLGDAAHAMTPFRGEGASHAIKDALALGKAIATCNSSGSASVNSALKAYQEEMLERGSEAARFSQLRYALENSPGAAPERMVVGHKIGPLTPPPWSLQGLH